MTGSAIYTVIDKGRESYFLSSIAGGYIYPFYIFNYADRMARVVNENYPMGEVSVSEIFPLMKANHNFPKNVHGEPLFRAVPDHTAVQKIDEMKSSDDTAFCVTLDYDERKIGFVFNKNCPEITLEDIEIDMLSNKVMSVFEHTDFHVDTINLAQTAREVAMHEGNVWTHVVSLRREDAERMGYNNLPVWRDLVKRHIDDIAAAQKIGRRNLKWYAAFHDKENNPHVHIVVYSQNPKEGFLTNVGIEKIRSVFANDIYRDELQNLYQKQTAVRNKLRSESDALMKSLVSELQCGNYSDPQLENLIRQLFIQLKNSKGKKQYGYLKPEVKKTVDAIVSCLAENPAIKKMYSEWCELEREKYFTYTGAVKSFPPLAENKVFKPIKNCVINTVLNMNCTLDSPECEIEKDTDKATGRLEFSAAAGNEYAKNLLENMDRYNQSAVQSAAASLLHFFAE